MFFASYLRGRPAKWPNAPSERRHSTNYRRLTNWQPTLERLEDRTLLSAGALDSTFGSGGIQITNPGSPDDEATNVFVQPDGKLLVVGFTKDTVHKDYALTLNRYQANGSLDTTYGTGGTVLTTLTSPNTFYPFSDRTFTFQPDDSLVILWPAGQGIPNGNEVTRYKSDGSLDTGFGTNGIVTPNGFNLDGSGFPSGPNALALQADGKILLTGSVLHPPTANGSVPIDVVLERLNANGSLDNDATTGFGPDHSGMVISDLGLHEEHILGLATALDESFGQALAVQPEGSILVAGYVGSFTANFGYDGFVARFSTLGSLDPSFGVGGEVILASTRAETDPLFPQAVPPAVLLNAGLQGMMVSNILVQTDAKILLGIENGAAVIRANPNGNLDTGFGPGSPFADIRPQGGASVFHVDGAGGILVMPLNPPQDSEGDHVFAVSRYNPDGTQDLSFGSGGTGAATIDLGADSYAEDFAVQSDGKIVLAGTTYDASKNGWDIALVRLIGDRLSSSGMQDALNSQPSVNPVTGNPTVTLQGSTQTQANAFLALFDPSTPGFTPLVPPTGATIDINVSLGAGLSLPTHDPVTIPSGIRVFINGGQWNGNSPALTLLSGDLTVTNASFANTTDAPTILVTGGHLTLRNDILQESTGYSQAAVAITGGTVDLGTTSSPGGNTLNINGAGAFVHNNTANAFAAAGDTFTVNGAPLAPASLSGIVFVDFNDDGQVDFGEKGIGGVPVTLTGTDFLGNAVNVPATTDTDGAYIFANLRPGNYYITESQPASYLQGIDSVGTAGGSLSATDQFFVQLAQDDSGRNGLNYNFGERPAAGGPIQHGQTAGIGFWNNRNGQALIKSLPVVTNADGSVTSIANWLAATLPHMFGANAGGNNLTAKSNAYVAALFQQDFLMKGVKLDAQVLATALSVYATNATLDSTAVAAQYGFTVSGTGLGTATVNVGSNGEAFGVANNTTMTILDLLLATDAQSANGVLYGGNAAKRNEANNVFSAVNQAGNIN